MRRHAAECSATRGSTVAANRNDFNADFIDQITRHVWCDIWTRPGLDQKTRRFMAITVMMALNRWEEFRLHVVGGLNAGDITKNDLKEIILQATVYCGAPVGNRAMKEAASRQGSRSIERIRREDVEANRNLATCDPLGVGEPRSDFICACRRALSDAAGPHAGPVRAGRRNRFPARVTAQELSDRLGRQFVIGLKAAAAPSLPIRSRTPNRTATRSFSRRPRRRSCPGVEEPEVRPDQGLCRCSVGALPLVLVVTGIPVTDLQSFVELLRRIGKHGYGTADRRQPSTSSPNYSVGHQHANPARAVPGHESGDPRRACRQLGNINGGTVRALAVTANKRSSVLPDVPTMQESGLKDFDFLFWGAVYAPAGTPDEIVQKLSTTIGEIMRDEKVGKRLRDVGNEPIGSSPAELDKYWKSEIDLYRKIVTDAGIKLEQ